eukprot:6304984-Lingulodinium_polyedra.AAC.1
MKILKPKPGVEETVSVEPFPILEPHEYFAWLYANHRGAFDKLFLEGDGSGSHLQHFWSTVKERKDPRLETHNLSDRPEWDTRAVPISIHGDAVPCVSIGKAGTKSYNIYSLSGLLGSGSTLEQKHY